MDPALATVTTRSTSLATHRVENLLERLERPVFLMDENVNTMYPFLETAAGGVRIQARPAEVKKALEVLAIDDDE